MKKTRATIGLVYEMYDRYIEDYFKPVIIDGMKFEPLQIIKAMASASYHERASAYLRDLAANPDSGVVFEDGAYYIVDKEVEDE